jgi:hypothetical protein
MMPWFGPRWSAARQDELESPRETGISGGVDDYEGVDMSKSTAPDCSIEGCCKPARAKTWCRMHYARWYRYGDPLEAKFVHGTVASYGAAHARVSSARGKASGHPCVDLCGRQAEDWSYSNNDPNEVVNKKGQRYSLDPAFYEPRCTRCHVAFDTLVSWTGS